MMPTKTPPASRSHRITALCDSHWLDSLYHVIRIMSAIRAKASGSRGHVFTSEPTPGSSEYLCSRRTVDSAEAFTHVATKTSKTHGRYRSCTYALFSGFLREDLEAGEIVPERHCPS
jgi:hypothetical protein